MGKISDHVGNRIRLYRKNKHFTLEQFAQFLHKSKSTISKYENGMISVDIETLYEIADVLKVDVRQLLDIHWPDTPTRPLAPSGFFSRCSRYYTYYLNKNSTRIVRGVLDIFEEVEEYSSIYYVDVRNYEEPNQCRHLYYGDIHYSDSFVNLVMQNQDNESERIFMNVINTFGRSTLTVGMLSGTSSKYMVPIALKTVISHDRLPEDEALMEALRITREDFALMRRSYCFSIDRLFEQLDE